MDDHREELSFPSVSPPYADPIVILAPPRLDYAANLASSAVPPRTRWHHFCDRHMKFVEYFISSVLIVVVLLFGTYQIALACYNCGLESTNLSWIRASFFLNFPFVLGVFVYIITATMSKKPPSFCSVIYIALWYTVPFFLYSIYLGIYYEIPEATQILTALKNATALDLLPCPARHYRHVIGMKIVNWCSLVIVIPPAFLLFSKKSCCDPRYNKLNNCDRFIFRIVNQWRYCMAVICRRHTGETVIEQF